LNEMRYMRCPVDDGIVSEEEMAFEMSYSKSTKKRLQKEQRLIDGVPIKMAEKLFKVPDVGSS